MTGPHRQKPMPDLNTFSVRPLTMDTWPDFEAVMGSNGAAEGCWCMYFRLPMSAYLEGRGEGNRQAMQALARQPDPPGLIGYLGETPVAWCTLGPRSNFSRLGRSRMLSPVDGEDVCAIPCLFVHRTHRRMGLMVPLLQAACAYAASKGYDIAEGYPVDPPAGKRVDTGSAYTGLASAFLKAGFEEVARRKDTRPIMRKWL